MKLMLIVIVFLLLGAFFIISENNLSIRSPSNRVEIGKLYLSWLGQLGINSVNLVGNVIKLEWLPENKTSG